MKKYQSYHFSPLNNRSMLMPRTPRGEAYVPDRSRAHRTFFEPVDDERIDPQHPYFQINTGITEKTILVNGEERGYAIYVPHGMITKGTAAVLFPESGVRAAAFLDSSGWMELAEKYHAALIVLESEAWKKEEIEKEFDYAWQVVQLEFGQRLTVDICESCIYPIGFGDGAYTATAFALTYSATFPAFAADGDCGVAPELIEVLKTLPSDGNVTQKKNDIAMPGFVIDRSGRAEAAFAYMREIIRARDDGLRNRFGRVYLEEPGRGAYFVNEQPIAQVWQCLGEDVSGISRRELDEEMLKFVLRFSLWGGSGNNYRRPKRTPEEMGMVRVYKEVNGLPRYWDVYVPSCYRPDDGRVYPLVVAIHGMSCNSNYFEETSDWHRLAEERGFFVCFASAYPHNDGLARFPVPHWALKTMGLKEKDELTYFKAMLEYMKETWSIDGKRIYAVGHSNGSQMTQTLAKHMPECFAAFGPTGSLDGWDPEKVEEIPGELKRPIWFMMGEYDINDASTGEGTIARATLEAYCRVNGVEPQYENWYDNGRYHTLVMYDEAHVPMVCYTVIRGCPHTYTPEMAQFTWDQFLCHYTREEDGTIKYHG